MQNSRFLSGRVPSLVRDLGKESTQASEVLLLLGNCHLNIASTINLLLTAGVWK